MFTLKWLIIICTCVLIIGLAFYDWESQELIRRIEIQPKNVYWSSENGAELVCISTEVKLQFTNSFWCGIIIAPKKPLERGYNSLSSAEPPRQYMCLHLISGILLHIEIWCWSSIICKRTRWWDIRRWRRRGIWCNISFLNHF